MAKHPGLPLSNHKPDNSFAMKTGHLEMLLTKHNKKFDKYSGCWESLKTSDKGEQNNQCLLISYIL